MKKITNHYIENKTDNRSKRTGHRKRIIPAIMALILAFAMLPSGLAAAETVETVFPGDTSAGAILRNLDYYDVRNSNTWAKEAIYEAGALEIIKGLSNMSKRFGRTDNLTKEEALAIVYKAAGREAEAQALGEAMNNARAQANRKTDALEVWYDGYLQLAVTEGLITAQDLADAMNADQTSLEADSFNRKSAVQRQEMARWLAGTLGIQPVRGQQDIFNNYLDWRSADPDKIPYIEAILENRIMNGDGTGRFRPLQAVTREQAAQILKNAESQVLTALKYNKQTGIIENISTTADYSGGMNTTGRYIDVRNTDGKLYRIETSLSVPAALNEQQGGSSAATGKELVAYDKGAIGGSSILNEGDRISYITRSSDNAVKFVNVLSNINDVRYVAAQINNNDSANLLINVTQLFRLDYPDIELAQQSVSFSLGSEQQNVSYRYSKNVAVTVDGRTMSMDDISPDMAVILTIGANNTVTAITSTDLDINSDAGKIVKGIVEENNPQLGYITLYNEDGSGTANFGAYEVSMLRTYNYVNENTLEIYKNHEQADIESIQAGDTAYLKLDDDGGIISVSAVDNYSVKYGRIISKLASSMAVEYENGTQQVLVISDDVLFIKDKKLVAYSFLKEGDRVRLLVNANPTSTELKEVTIEGDEHYITSIYKGQLLNIDEISDKVKLWNLQFYNNGKWERTSTKGMTAIPLAEGCTIYANDTQMTIRKVNSLLVDNEAYIAVEKDYGGNENAIMLSFRNSSDKEVLYTDNISSLSSGSGKFNLQNAANSIMFGAGSIVVKFGRLVTGSSLSAQDMAMVVANRAYDTGYYNAGIIRVDEQKANTFAQVYRARISVINENQDFKVESFSMLSETNWNYYNTEKTFVLSSDTRLLGDEGLLNIRDFLGYGEDSYIGRVVYVLADGADAILLSTAPYGVNNVKGTVYEVSGATYGEEEGLLMEEPTTLKLRNTSIYSTASYSWTASQEMEISLLLNTIIIKNGAVAKPSDIKKGDVVKVVKKDATVSGDAYIITVE